MQHHFVGDVGDFGKYGLLRSLIGEWPESEPRLTLGVVWYLPAGAIGSAADGQKLTYLSQPHRYRSCDPRLYDALGLLIDGGDRRLGAIDASGVLGDDTAFFDGRVPHDLRSREKWLQEALQAVEGRDIVFFDPDKGLAPPSAGRNSTEHAYVHEVEAFVRNGQTVVVYHHLGRTSKHPVQIRNWAERLTHELRLDCEPQILWYRRGTARAYFVIPASAHAATIGERLKGFGRSEWFMPSPGFKFPHFTPLPTSPGHTPDSAGSSARSVEPVQLRPEPGAGSLGGYSTGGLAVPGRHPAATTSEQEDRTVVRLSDFHPWIAERAEPLFVDGHYRSAIVTATQFLEAEWRSLLGVEGLSLSELARMSFDRRGPARDEPRLRFRGYGSRDSPAWKNAHDGARQYALGCVKRIRNLAVHHPQGAEPDATETLEILGALSTLARWVTEARVVTAR
ncbi:MAG: hypothetical protein F4Z31_21325 [Gemmatimonadetes bacterium]|nr:hypothetical protein [Gemmatimonadota bacterium]MYE77064.1 hypothetical protein [Acidimicrobiaceae bacterium]MYJ82165.1 hypothetical protein [Acidimicrobiaceae bacterium]